MEILKNVSVNWLGKKWYFFGFSWFLLALGVVGYFVHGGLALGIDFKGGTVVNLKFNQSPDMDQIRKALKPEAVGSSIIQRYGNLADNAVIVRMQQVFAGGQNADAGRKQLQTLLKQTFDPEHIGSSLIDFNNVGTETLAKNLLDTDPDNWASQGKSAQEIQTHYRDLAAAMINYRDKIGGGIVGSLDNLKSVVRCEFRCPGEHVEDVLCRTICGARQPQRGGGCRFRLAESCGAGCQSLVSGNAGLYRVSIQTNLWSGRHRCALS